MTRPMLHAGWLAGGAFAGVLLAMALPLDGYSHALHPVDVLGARGVPRAVAWNVLGFGVPGVLLAIFALALQPPFRRDGIGAAGRIGGWLLAISALSFAAAGLLPLDLGDLDGPGSKRHVAASMLAWLAWLPSALLLPFALRRKPAWRPSRVAGPLLALAAVACLALPLQQWLPVLEGRAGAVQRIGLALYFAWPALLAWSALSRIGSSTRG